MARIDVRSDMSEQERLDRRVVHWPVWEKGVSVFPWFYEFEENCYIVEGEAIVTGSGMAPVTIKAGDFVTFEEGLTCRWEITQPLKKHYQLG
ncbi:cupin domain-containing protein [Thiomicrospira sp. R3]|uniref:cupin domain-containing protein n=1 Tax=Thiomicrospira sp. R3 TaxID=3035472 RepID=UPI00259BA49A|nr:cupin domain-containing protein [Thiomicrospira sp. R3]WFE68912.1 cupin domain-containing protein [Thiomicrospira sp. R3]